MKVLTRRRALTLAGAALSAPALAAPALASGGAKVVVVGGGFGGAAAARALRQADPTLEVTLLTRETQFVTCPFSNLVIAGQLPVSAITFGYEALAADGIRVQQGTAVRIEADRQRILLQDGGVLAYDRVILSPGIELNYTAVPGYDEAAADRMPHAWQGGAQTLLLRDMLAAMPQGGTFLMSVPDNPYRCPPGPYERASLVAHYLSQSNPSAKIIIVDGKDSFSKQSLFLEGWEALYPGMIRHVPFAETAGLMEVDAGERVLRTAFEDFTGDVVNFIPPQRAAAVARDSGLTGTGDWCQINQATFESVYAPGVHIIGDAAIVGDMPKSAFSATAQARLCARVVAALLRGAEPPAGTLLNTCYSLVSPDYGISVAGVYRLNGEGLLKSVEGTGGNSPAGADAGFRSAEAAYARDWYAAVTSQSFGQA